MHKYFNPKKFIKIAERILPFSIIATILFFISGIYFALIASPVDYQQGETVRIMYVHVPSAWLALSIYSLMAIFAASALIWKNPFAYILTSAAAPIGASFTLICLVTGAIWGKPIWGTWWVWDARLTSMLVLFFLYLGYLILYHSHEDKEYGGKISSILLIIGFINIPIIKFSVNWWNTLHQPASLIRLKGIAIDGSMLTPLLLMSAAFLSFFIMLFIIRVKKLMLEIKIEKIQSKKLGF